MSEKSRFTPGDKLHPGERWTVTAYPNLAAAQEDGCFEWAEMGDWFNGEPVGVVWKKVGSATTGLPGCAETTLDRAYVIAAAPAMRDALDDLLFQVQQLRGEEAQALDLDEARRALAAARGEVEGG